MCKFTKWMRVALITVLCLSLSLLFVACGEPGEKGDKGDTGAAGVGIVSIAKDSTSGNVDTYKITMSNGNTSTFIVTNGRNGSDGQNGQNGQDGADGISVTNAQIVNGELILSFSQGNSINLGKVVGDDGQNGTNGTDGKDGVGIKGIVLSNEGELTITLTNDTPINLGNVKGNNGKSAYEMYKEKNPAYTGDEDQWMSDLVNGKLSTVQVTKYTVTFDSNGGTPVDPQQVEKGEKVIQPDNPTREGYTFLGWYGGKYGDEKWVFIGYDVTESITLTAKWEENIYTITFNSNGGNSIEPIEIKYNQQITLPVAIRNEFAFAGWLQNGQLIDETIVITGDVTLTAKWVAPTYDITFDINGGDSNVETRTYNYGEAYILPIPTKEGSEFAGWFVGEQQITDGIWKFEENMTLVAEWTAIPYTISFESWIHASYGIELGDLTVYYNQPYELPKLDTFGDCRFDCWLNSKGEIVESGVWKNTESITLTAKWIDVAELFEFNVMGDRVIITKYIGTAANVVVPTTIGGLKVIISQSTFQNNEFVEFIEFDSDFIAFQEKMFSGCNNLQKITISSAWKGELYSLFGNDISAVPKSFSAIQYAEGSDSIDSTMWKQRVAEHNITLIFASDREIGEFSNCIGLTTIVISSEVTGIHRGAFSGCYNLVGVEFEKGSRLRFIGSDAFADCRSLTHINIPDSVCSIGDKAFRGCNSLTSIYLPFIGATSYYDDLLNENGEESFDYIFGDVPKSLQAVTIKYGVVCRRAFSDCSNLKSIVILDGYYRISDYAFSMCTNLSNIELPIGTRWIESHAFHGCSSLVSLELPSSVDRIGEYAFCWCTNLQIVKVPINVGIGKDAFWGCENVTIYYEE